MIRRGEQKALQSFGLRSEIVNHFRILCGSEKFLRRHEFTVLQLARNIEHRLAFADSEWPLVNIAVCQRPENVLAPDRMVEMVFASLQRAPRMLARINFKCDGVADYAVLLQQACHAAAGRPMRQVHKNAFARIRPVGLFNCVPRIYGDGRGNEQDQQEELRQKLHLALPLCGIVMAFRLVAFQIFPKNDCCSHGVHREPRGVLFLGCTINLFRFAAEFLFEHTLRFPTG